MNRIILTVILLLIFSMSFGQFTCEIKGGLNLSTIKSTENFDTNLKPAFHIGISATYSMSKRFAITSDLLHSCKGFDKIHLSYVNIPVLVRYSVTSRFSAEAGVGAGYLLSSFSLEGINYSNEIDTWGNRLDFELCAGVRYTLNSRISFSLRYEYGLSNIIAKNATAFTYKVIHKDDFLIVTKRTSNVRDDFSLADYNRNFQLSVSYRLTALRHSI